MREETDTYPGGRYGRTGAASIQADAGARRGPGHAEQVADAVSRGESEAWHGIRTAADPVFVLANWVLVYRVFVLAAFAERAWQRRRIRRVGAGGPIHAGGRRDR